jgi:hypothetical protein
MRIFQIVGACVLTSTAEDSGFLTAGAVASVQAIIAVTQSGKNVLLPQVLLRYTMLYMLCCVLSCPVVSCVAE